MSSSVPLLVARNLRKAFPVAGGRFFRRTVGSVAAVDDVSFDIGRGETLGLVGESGCGKSTTGRLLMRLVEPDSGTVRFAGTELTTLGRKALDEQRKRLQLMFQDASSAFNPRMRVGRIVAEPMRLAGMAGDLQKSRVAELLPLVGLPAEYAARFPHQFSGGQRQRIGIARALALQPDMIICDEPVSALDVSVQAQVVNLMQDLQDRLRLTYLFISHDLRVVRHVADRVAVMYLGRIVELAPAAELYRRPQHPYTQMLLRAVPGIDPGARRVPVIAAGEAEAAVGHRGCRFSQRCPRAAAVCIDEPPALQSIAPDHFAACHFPI